MSGILITANTNQFTQSQSWNHEPKQALRKVRKKISDRVVLVRIVLKWLHERTGLDFGLQGFFVPLGLKQSDQIESLAREHHKDKRWDNS